MTRQTQVRSTEEALSLVNFVDQAQPAQQIADSPDDWSDWRVIPPQSQPAPMIRGDIRDGLVDDEPAHQHIEHCLWARNGNQPCPHVQPAQKEPVAWISKHGVVYPLDAKDEVHPINELQPLYTSPPAQRKPLTDEEIEKVWRRVQANDFHDCVQPFARAIEATHGITKE